VDAFPQRPESVPWRGKYAAYLILFDADTYLSKQFAYNEASFVLIRLLQQFDRFTVTQAISAPEGGVVPHNWKYASGRKGTDDIWPQSAITLFSKVQLNIYGNYVSSYLMSRFSGWSMAANACCPVNNEHLCTMYYY
jgi:hypothetical protein